MSTRNFIPMSSKYDRIILLVDMDCFYCQVEEKLDPLLKGQPLAVVQYNAWKGGGIIAVNYPARAKGVTRHMRGDEAKEQCPEIQLVKVPNVREKADLTKYREAGKDVANVLQRFTPLLERASVDEAYLDITESVNKRLLDMNEGTFVLQPQKLINTYAVGFSSIGDYVTTITTSYTNPLVYNDDFYRNFQENDIPAVRQSNIRLLIGASIASEIRAAVQMETGYDCSAGIAHNKILAKLACGMNKPNKQTLLPLAQIGELFETLPVGKIKGLGAKYGEEVCERLSIRYLGQLLKFTELELQKKFDEKNGSWLYNICRGIDLEAVTPRFYSKSIGCCKKFPGRNNITGIKTLQHWLLELANEISERLEKDVLENNRRAKQMVVNFIQEFNSEEISSSRSAPLNCYESDVLAKIGMDIIKSNTTKFFRSGSESVLNNPIKFLGISVGKFETISNSQNNIQDMFAQQAAKKKRISGEAKIETATNNVENSTSTTKVQDIVIKAVTSDRKQCNVKSFFANALQKQNNRNPAELPQNEVKNSNEFGDITKEIASIDSCSRNNMIKVVPCGTKQAEDLVDQLPSKSFFRNHFKKDDKKPTAASNDITLDIEKNIDSEQKSFFVKALRNNVSVAESSPIIPNVEENISETNEETVCNINENSNDNTELNDLINDIQSMHPETDDTLHCGDTPEFQNQIPSPGSSTKRKFDKICNEDVPNTNDDYRSQYAEFAIPELRPELLQLTKCSTCGAKIPNDLISIQSHEDHHFALELSQKQRFDFREEIRTKINATKSPPSNGNKKVKKTTGENASKRPINTAITKFLKPSSPCPVVPRETPLRESGLEICDICKVPLKREEISEHKDFHIAKDLQRRLNQLEVHTVDMSKKSPSETSRRNLNTSLVTRQSKVIAKPISQFFTQSNT